MISIPNFSQLKPEWSPRRNSNRLVLMLLFVVMIMAFVMVFVVAVAEVFVVAVVMVHFMVDAKAAVAVDAVTTTRSHAKCAGNLSRCSSLLQAI
jgi:uncharacterized membrane protein YdbT with pleckstrin-like domain